MKKSLYLALCVVTTMLSGCIGSGNDSESMSENPVIDAIVKRRSIRQYTDKSVSRELLQKVAECGIMAPSSHNNQIWEIRIVDDKDWIDQCSDAYIEAVKKADKYDKVKFMFSQPYKNIFRNAPAVIFVATKPAARFASEGIGMLGQNMMLAAVDLGLGTCALGTVLEIFSEPGMESYVQSLGFSEGYTLRYALAIGYPAETPDSTPRDRSKIKFLEL